MGKLVLFKAYRGDVDQDLSVILQIGDEGQPYHTEINGNLPPIPEISQYYQDWQSIYLSLRTTRRLEATTEEFTHIGDAYQDCLQAADLLGNSLNNWLNSNEFRPVKERLLENLSKCDEVRIILQVDDILMRLPWHLWDFFERYPKAELALGTQNYAPVDKLSPTTDKVRILAILGNSYGMDVDKDRALLEQLPNAEVQFLTEPQRREINDQLWEQPWDIFFFAGHSRTDAETGRISINQTDSLTIDELRHGLRKAIAQGLQLAIFNSCDGLGLAQQLANLQIPQVIVMREPVPDKVAQEFLKYFIRAFSQGESFYLAVRQKALVPVIGPSGSGKSSVVFAGLISQLRDEGNWLIDSFRPKNRPFNELVTALVRLLEPKLGETRQLVEAGELAVALRQGTVTLRSVMDRLLQKNPGFQVLLVGDQFEELYTLCRDKEERDRFVDELLSAVASVSFDRTPNFSFVFTLRADFYGYVLSYRPFRDALEKFTPQLLGPMIAQELQAAIEKPAEQFGVQLESGLTG